MVMKPEDIHLLFGDGTMVELGQGLFRKQLLKIGEWIHPKDPSQRLTITKDLIRKMIANFKAGVLDKVPVPDRHTDSALANTGYVVGLEETEDGMDAILKIDDPAALDKMQRKLIPGISAGFRHNYTDKKTGKEVGPVLFHAALVDNPYLKGMRDFEPVALSEGEDAVQHVYVLQLDDKGGKKNMNKDELIAELKKHGVDVAALEATAAKVPDLEKQVKDKDTLLSDAAKAFGETIQLSDGETVADGIKKLAGKVGEKETENTKLSDRIGNLETSLKKRDAADAVAKLIGEGKVTPAQSAEFEELYLSDVKMFEKITAKLTKQVELGELGTDEGTKPGSGKLSEEDAEKEIERLAAAHGIK